jgi:hypothetical protein
LSQSQASTPFFQVVVTSFKGRMALIEADGM